MSTIGVFSFIRRQPILRLLFFSSFLVCLAGIRVFAAAIGDAAAPSQLDIFTMGMGLVGGLALFLFGMEQLADALKARAGDSLKDVLARLTTNRVTGALTGAFVTACVQSSSVTTVLVVGFITANIMSLSQSVSVIFGANIGSTVTAQIIAFKVTKYALLLVAVGFAASFLGKKEEIKQYGFMCMGMGMIFLGMGMMSNAMNPLRSYGPFLELMTQMESPLLAIHGSGRVHRPDPVLSGDHGHRHRHGRTGVDQSAGGHRPGVWRQHRHLHHGAAGIHWQAA